MKKIMKFEIILVILAVVLIVMLATKYNQESGDKNTNTSLMSEIKNAGPEDQKALLLITEQIKNEAVETNDSIQTNSNETNSDIPVVLAINAINDLHQSSNLIEYSASSYIDGYEFKCIYDICLLSARVEGDKEGVFNKWQVFLYTYKDDVLGLKPVTKPFYYHSSGMGMPNISSLDYSKGTLSMGDGDECYSESSSSIIDLDRENDFFNPRIVESFSRGNDCSSVDFLTYGKDGTAFEIKPILSEECKVYDGTQSVLVSGLVAVAGDNAYEYFFPTPYMARCEVNDYQTEGIDLQITYTDIDFGYYGGLRFGVTIGTLDKSSYEATWVYSQTLGFNSNTGFNITPY